LRKCLIKLNIEMSDDWKPYAIDYDPIKVGSIDATDTQPHDRAITRAIKVYKSYIQFNFNYILILIIF